LKECHLELLNIHMEDSIRILLQGYLSIIVQLLILLHDLLQEKWIFIESDKAQERWILVIPLYSTNMIDMAQGNLGT